MIKRKCDRCGEEFEEYYTCSECHKKHDYWVDLFGITIFILIFTVIIYFLLYGYGYLPPPEVISSWF